MKTITTTLVFAIQQNEILLAMKKRGHGEGNWNGAGGKVDADETIEQAMVRECQEEIGITPTEYHQVAEHTFHQPYKGEPCINTVHIYVCTAWSGEPTESDEMAPRWFPIDSIPYSHMWPDDIYWLHDVLDGKKLRGDFRYDDHDNVLSHTITEVRDFS
jgi:mutator protein MutT